MDNYIYDEVAKSLESLMYILRETEETAENKKFLSKVEYIATQIDDLFEDDFLINESE